jgi:16S rRNA (cytidine1402-2'-O)-methyltransferase
MKLTYGTNLSPGLYIVATPIGNLRDITLRAIETLRGVAAVACEDTRVTGKLLQHLDIKQRLIRYDDHADERSREGLLAMMADQAVALVSDAGTPLVSDPGYRLVRECRERGIAVTSLPGPSAAIVGITLSGLPSDKFLFAGFLPSKEKAREHALAELAVVPSTLVFYETSPRLPMLWPRLPRFCPPRSGGGARIDQDVRGMPSGTPDELIEYYTANPPRGEIVLMVGPPVARRPVWRMPKGCCAPNCAI